MFNRWFKRQKKRDSPVLKEAPRPFRLVQLETSFACTLSCIMCPWHRERTSMKYGGIMPRHVWGALRPHLDQVASIDFSGGGEPLLQPSLAPWIGEARSHGCQTGFLTNAVSLTPGKTDELLGAGLDWICFSLDGADKETYESIRKGADFDQVCENIAGFCRAASGQTLLTMINVVIMTVNARQIENMVRLASDLGVAQVNFKHCDVIRGNLGKDLGVFGDRPSTAIRSMEKALKKAKKLGASLGVSVTSFSFTPEERPVCVQDPRDSLFVRYDGAVAPCIGLAYGGPTTFLGQDALMPTLTFGHLGEQDFSDMISSQERLDFVNNLDRRVRASESGFLSVDLSEPSLQKLKAANQAAMDAMPPAPEGCRVCHYLYGI